VVYAAETLRDLPSEVVGQAQGRKVLLQHLPAARRKKPLRRCAGRSRAGAAGARAMTEQAEQIRAELRRQFPQEFEHGYRTGYFGEFQFPEEFHTWPLVRKNSWYAGWNLGNSQRQADHE
jgi:hypothetical protein